MAERTCFACDHAVYPHGSTYCWKYQEEILDEKAAAEDCPLFIPLPELGRPLL